MSSQVNPERLSQVIVAIRSPSNPQLALFRKTCGKNRPVSI